jgi:hypothetical protein
MTVNPSMGMPPMGDLNSTEKLNFQMASMSKRHRINGLQLRSQIATSKNFL